MVLPFPCFRLPPLKTPPLEWRPWNGLAIFSKDGIPPPWGNNVWAAWITARARARLAREITTLEERGARILYCDTDSVIYQPGRVAGRYPAKAKEVGQFELRGKYNEVVIVGKKEYALRQDDEWEIMCKGVPKAQRMTYLQHGGATFVRPVKVRESSRIGIPANVWRPVHKVRRTDLREKARRTDGALPIPVIDGTED